MSKMQRDRQPGLRIGQLAKSLAGHDKDQIYVIVDMKAEGLYVADGKYRSVERPKRKNRRHVQPIDLEAKELLPGLRQPDFRDEEIRSVLQAYRQHERNGGIYVKSRCN